MMEFLYFPQDKSEYIPAVLMLIVFIVAAAATMILIIKASQKEEKKIDEKFGSEEQPTQNQKPR
ncbi:hypothetical protein [Halobacillus litoralis]|uniref:Uncharacterized protein n=1 Tax=Halobacillus litoralis TaxID=45668 RepID=A0A410MGI9_9BACI|nr:hypothetical protein [Halobacillus litoralis]QAS53859.1 hypothetical protein HLI_17395 [Halobacillus litoralis]